MGREAGIGIQRSHRQRLASTLGAKSEAALDFELEKTAISSDALVDTKISAFLAAQAGKLAEDGFSSDREAEVSSRPDEETRVLELSVFT